MAKKTDSIDRLMRSYNKTSSARIAGQKQKDARYEAQVKARIEFEDQAVKKITDVVRPVMKKFLERLSKQHFSFKIDPLKTGRYIAEEYVITGKKEKELELYFAIKVHEEKNKVAIMRGYVFHEYDEDYREYIKWYSLNEINEAFIKKQFIEGLKKICL